MMPSMRLLRGVLTSASSKERESQWKSLQKLKAMGNGYHFSQSTGEFEEWRKNQPAQSV